VSKFRIQYAGGGTNYLFEGSVGVTGHSADITFPSTYWPEASTILINELKMYVTPGTSN
jgi:hypothetical protein